MDMLVGKEMILTVLVISVALGAVTELQIVPVQLGPSAHSTFVHRLSAVSGLCGVHLAFEILFSPDLLRRNSAVIASHQEEDDEIQQRSNDRTLPTQLLFTKEYTMKKPYRIPIHFILIGMKKYSMTCIFG